MIQLLDNVYEPHKVRMMLKQTDLDNFNTLDLMGKLKMYRAMQTKVADRVIQDTWISKVDVSGSFLENSTAFDHIFFKKLESADDFESKRRFYHKRDLLEDIRPNQFAYRVWFQSMNLRYYIEMAFFLVNVLVFQLYISKFNADLHKLDKDIEHLIDIGVFQRDKEGRILADDLKDIDYRGRFDAAQIEDIESTREHLAHEIELAVYELDDAMYIAMVSFSFPFQLLMAFIYAKYTNRNFIVRSSSLIDLAITSCVFIWFEKFEVYINDDNDGFKLTEPPHEYHRFMQRLLNDVNSGEFHFDWLLAGTAFLFWIRLIFMLQLTNTFGPLIRTTAAMLKDLIKFFLLFIIQLVAFSCVGVLSFGKLKEYETLWDALIMFF